MFNHFKRFMLLKPFQNQSRLLKNTTYCLVSNHNSSNRNNIFNVLNPYIDFTETYYHEKICDSLEQRKIKLDTQEVVNLWKQYTELEEKKLALEEAKIEVVEKIKACRDIEKKKEEINGLKIKGKLIRKDLKNISNVCSDLEQTLLPIITRLPNSLENYLYTKEVEEFLIPNSQRTHHLKIAEELDLIEYLSPVTYFLKNEAAEFELIVPTSFVNFFCKNNFICFSNPDFSRSLLIEGCTVNTRSLIQLEHEVNENFDNLYMNGTASLLPFCSFHAKHITEKVPVRYVSQGRHYTALHGEHEDGLYSVCQHNAVQIFVACPGSNVVEEFNNCVQLISEMYKKLDLPFRMVKIQPFDLELSEALRLSFQIHSPFRNEYIEVGNLSYYSDYISKKLRMYYKNNENNDFMFIISGTIVKVPPLLGTVLENHCKIPDILSFKK